MSELLNKNTAANEQSLVTSVKSNQNITNINITSKTPASSNGNSNSNDLQVFQKGPQVALVANIPGLDVNKDSHTALPVRSRSSLSNVSSTQIPSPDSHNCHKGHRKHRTNSKEHSLESKLGYRKHHHCNREKDYNSETNSTSESISRHNKKNVENGHHNHRHTDYRIHSEKEYSSDMSLMDQNYKKATRIVHDLTRHKDTSLYEKHKQKCITASEKYNSDLLRHYNVRKSSSVVDFRSEVHIKPKYADSKSVEELDAIENERKPNGINRILESRSVKSLDFDSDTNSMNAPSTNSRLLDYASEPNDKPRPIPPKKPIRLSLHKTQNNGTDTSSIISNGSSSKCDPRKPMKRNHKGETPPVSVTVKVEGNNSLHNGTNYSSFDNLAIRSNREGTLLPMRWTSFSQMK